MKPLRYQGSARIAVLEAYSIDLASKPWDPLTPQISGTKSVVAGRQWDQLQAGKVIALVEILPQPVRSWIKWAYGPQLERFSGPEFARLSSWISAEVYRLAELSEVEYSPLTIERIINACAFAAFNARHLQNTGGPLYTAKQIREALGLAHRQQWARDIRPWYNQALDWFEAFDKRGLGPVGTLLHKERGAANRDDPHHLPGDGQGYVRSAVVCTVCR